MARSLIRRRPTNPIKRPFVPLLDVCLKMGRVTRKRREVTGSLSSLLPFPCQFLFTPLCSWTQISHSNDGYPTVWSRRKDSADQNVRLWMIQKRGFHHDPVSVTNRFKFVLSMLKYVTGDLLVFFSYGYPKSSLVLAASCLSISTAMLSAIC